MRSPNRLLALLIFLVAAASLLSVNDALLYTPDSARYLIWARSLAQLDGFNDPTLPDPTRYVVHAPFYPFLLIPAAWIDPGGVEAAKVTNILLGSTLVFLFFRWLRRSVGSVVAGWTSGLLAVNALTLIYSTQVLSEVPFAIALVTALMLAEDLDEPEAKHTTAELAGVVLALGAAMFLREIGVTLVAAFVLLWWSNGHRRQALVVGGLCLLLYALWFVRNEVIVAGLEQPPLRNSRLLTAHLYTSQDESLAAELLARFLTNARVYSAHLSSLIFAPDLGVRSHGLIRLDVTAVQWTMAALTYLRPVYLALTIGLPVMALALGRSGRRSVMRIAAFLCVYSVPVLLYPINDIRFLYPLLVGLLYLGAVGAREVLVRWGSRFDRRLLVPSALLAALLAFGPHAVWAASYISGNWRLAHDREALMSDPATPDYYRKTLAEAGTWIRENIEAGTTILSRWKEVALEAGDRKVLDVDPQMTPDNFDRTVRDYDVRYVVSILWGTGLRENEQQLEYSARYAFVPVHRVGSVEILRVEDKPRATGPARIVRSTDDSVDVFRTAIRVLRRGEPAVAESLLVSVERRMGRYASIVYQQGVAKALAGRLDDAMAVFERVRSIPQAGSLLQLAWYHQEIIARLRSAQGMGPGIERATRFHIVAVNYWELGYREASYRMLDSALASEPSFFPALIFASIFRYQDGDPMSAEQYLRRAEAVQPTNPLVTTMLLVLEDERVWLAARTAQDRVEARRRQAGALRMVDMRDNAIDAWRGVLLDRPDDPAALASLVQLMSDKRRFGPAREYARRWVAVSPNDAAAREALADLERRW